MEKKVKKRLQALYAWADFYNQNKQFDKIEKIQEEITQFKKENNLE